MKQKIKNAAFIIVSVIGMISFLGVIGTAGALETDQIPVGQAVIQWVINFIDIGLCVIIAKMLNVDLHD